MVSEQKKKGGSKEHPYAKQQYMIMGDCRVFNSLSRVFARQIELGVSDSQVLMIYPRKKTQKLIHILRKHNQL